jgi:hypothetical protein
MFLKWWRGRKRQIFRYFDGSKMRAKDPIAVMEDIASDQTFRPGIHTMLLEKGDPEAIEVTIQMTVRVFGIQLWDEETEAGLTRVEVLNLMFRFGVFVDDLKKKYECFPILQESMEALKWAIPSTSAGLRLLPRTRRAPRPTIRNTWHYIARESLGAETNDSGDYRSRGKSSPHGSPYGRYGRAWRWYGSSGRYRYC